MCCEQAGSRIGEDLSLLKLTCGEIPSLGKFRFGEEFGRIQEVVLVEW